MIELKVLLVEDDAGSQEVFRDSVAWFNAKHKGQINVTPIIESSLDKAKAVLDGTFDGAILDLKLEDDELGGNKIAANINELFLRIPVIFVTGYPDSVEENPIIVKKYARGSETYESDLELIRDIKNTGLTHIMGGRGVIEETLNDVFLKNLLPQINTWIAYGGADSKRTERALLRHTLNHLLQLLDNDEDKSFPEEAFICPPLAKTLKTGSIVENKASKNYFVVLNPACDLVIRQTGTFKTDCILVAEIESNKTVLDVALSSMTNATKIKTKAMSVLSNNHTDYFHCLPQTTSFQGGFVNFRKLNTLSKEAFDEAFNLPAIQISPAFVKDIVARFSSYYARQGQPDIDFDKIINQLTAST